MIIEIITLVNILHLLFFNILLNRVIAFEWKYLSSLTIVSISYAFGARALRRRIPFVDKRDWHH